MANGTMFLTPEQALAAEAEARRQGAFAQGFSPVSASAQELGRGIAGAFGRAIGALSQQSPEVQLARVRTQAVQGLDPANPQTFMDAARNLYSAGDIQGATTLLSQYQAIVPKGEEVKAYKPGDVLFRGGKQIATVPGEAKETMDDFTRAIDLRQNILNGLKEDPKNSQLRTDLKDVNARIARLSTITGRTPEDITANQRGKMRGELDNIQQSIELLQGLSEEYSKNPGAAGAVGALKETMGALSEQLLGGTGEQISAYLGTEKARQIRTETRLALGRLLPVITGDTSGRYTDAEKTFAEETLGGLGNLTSDQSVVTALQSIVKLLEDSERRMQQRLGKEVPTSVNQITTPEEYDALPDGAEYEYEGVRYKKGSK